MIATSAGKVGLGRSRVKATLVALFCVMVACLVAALVAPAARASEFTVNTTTDAPGATAPVDGEADGVCDSDKSTQGDQCTLRAAIQQANALDGDDTIGFDPSVFDPSGTSTIVLDGSELFIDSNLEIKGPGADAVTVNAGGKSRVFNVQGGTVKISGLTITGGSAPTNWGGGIYKLAGTLTVSDSTISDNAASYGGGIQNFDGTLTVFGSSISKNTATRDGGGINNFGTMMVERSAISGNVADRSGGGIYSQNNSPSHPSNEKTTITNSTISGNTAKEYGGGVYNENGTTAIEHSTITKNTAPTDQGSGVASRGDDSAENQYIRTDVLSSIISDSTNTDMDCVDFEDSSGECDTSFVSEGYNLLGDGNATGNLGQSTDKVIGNNDPGLEPLTLNAPGTTQTHALTATSPALDSGSLGSDCPATDQRGVGRPQLDGCDIGAFEVEGPPPDETDPVLTLPDDVTEEATGPDGAAVAFQVSATDETGPTNPEVSCTKGDPSVAVSPEGETFPIGTTEVKCSATDTAGNRAEGSFKVNVTQTKVALDVKPQTCPNPLSSGATGSYPVAIVGTGDLDVSQIDTAKPIQLEGVEAQALSKGAIKDVATPFAGTITDPPQAGQCTKAGADGKQDLNLKFDTQQIVKALGQVTNKEVRVLKLTAYLKDGTYIKGEDVVVTSTTSTTKRK